MIVRAWAVVCKSGEIHMDCILADEERAKEESRVRDKVWRSACGPHRVVPLRGEVADARKK